MQSIKLLTFLFSAASSIYYVHIVFHIVGLFRLEKSCSFLCYFLQFHFSIIQHVNLLIVHIISPFSCFQLWLIVLCYCWSFPTRILSPFPIISLCFQTYLPTNYFFQLTCLSPLLITILWIILYSEYVFVGLRESCIRRALYLLYRVRQITFSF